MRRKFKLKVSYTFNGCFILRAASGKEAARLVFEQCGTVLNDIQTTLGEDAEIDWNFGKHPALTVREVCALGESIDGETSRKYGFFIPGSGSSGVIPQAKHRDIIPSARVMTTWKNPRKMTSFRYVFRLRKPKSTRVNYARYSVNTKFLLV